ncbi:MAG: formate/nitrite transporter family protein [Clostridia bacterium]|nr:formate/nitrite transporter family protein [Clostridia bacterium]
MQTPSEFVTSYALIGQKKAKSPATKLLVLGVLAGFLIGMGAAVTNTAGHALTNPSVAKIVSGLLFPFGLIMVILTGAELFTGNCLITISVLEKKVDWKGMLRNWFYVYVGNFIGALLLAMACTYSGPLSLNSNGVAVYTMKVAAGKCALTFGNAFVLGILCNVLVCIAVAMSLMSKNTVGRAIGAYLPIAFFVICGFEHSVANMYYITAGLLAKNVPAYAEAAAAAELDVSALTWWGFLVHNLLPVTLGNIVGGCSFGALMWFAHGPEQVATPAPVRMVPHETVKKTAS